MFRRRISITRAPGGTARSLFHGVAVKSSARFRCPAALAVDGIRFLSDEAPQLPLRGCASAQSCKCVYEHFVDRRTSLRRDSDIGCPPKISPSVERRTYGPRRITDA